MEKSDIVLHDLSRGITQKERTALLQKIKTSLSLDEGNSGLQQEEMDKDEKNALIRKEKQHFSMLRRFLLCLKAKISGKSEDEVLLAGKLLRIKRKIRRKDANLTGFETRNLTPHFAELVYELYKSATPLLPLFKILWLDERSYNLFFLEIIEDSLSDKIEMIEDIVPFEDIVAAFGISGRKEDVQNVIIERLDRYIEKIKKDVFKNLEHELLPFYRLKDLVLFPYVQFFQQFGYTLLDTPYTDKPHFKNASAALCLDDLEKLYFAVYSALKLEKRVRMSSKLASRMENLAAYTETDTNRTVSADLENLISKVNAFSDKVPLADLIRYFKKNPFIKMIFYIQGIDLREFYRNSLKIKLLQLLDEQFPAIQKQYVIMEIDKLFKGKRFVKFQNYREYSSIDYEKLGVSSFRYVEPLSLVYNFIECFYRGRIQSIVRVLEKSVLSQNRLIRDNMLQYASTMEDVSEKIRVFDNSLSPDSEEGKIFHKLRFTMVKDISQQKIFRKIVIQKDREAKNLGENGIEALGGLKRVFSEVNKSTNDVIIDQLKQHYLIDNKPVVLQELLDDSIEKLKMTEHLYHHMLITV